MKSIREGGENLNEQKILDMPEMDAQEMGASEDTLPEGTVILPDNTPEGSVDIEQLQAAHEEKLRQVRIEGEVRYVLAKMGAKNPTLAAKVLDLTEVRADDDGVTGVEEAVKQIMTTDPYLFGLSMGAVGGERSSGGVHGTGRRDPNGMSDKEYYAYVMGKR